MGFCPTVCSRWSLFSIAYLALFVKHFFEFFEFVFRARQPVNRRLFRFVLRPLAGQLSYNTTPTKQKSTPFFCFFEIVCSFVKPPETGPHFAITLHFTVRFFNRFPPELCFVVPIPFASCFCRRTLSFIRAIRLSSFSFYSYIKAYNTKGSRCLPLCAVTLLPLPEPVPMHLPFIYSI